MDTYIAISPKCARFIVTVDIDDFEIIKKDMKQLVVVPAKEFFA